jgi:hypothetical protein
VAFCPEPALLMGAVEAGGRCCGTRIGDGTGGSGTWATFVGGCWLLWDDRPRPGLTTNDFLFLIYFQKKSILFSFKNSLLELENFEIKCGCEGF